MSKIKVLDKVLAELIAAGEVVERPASIVKELLENSIDAGSTKITVEIKGGGIGYIRITDNGSGIDGEDLPNAFLRHATSKVTSIEDLDHIGTLGFRGEALSSIAAVSKVQITSKTIDNLDAMVYEVWGGSALEIPTSVGAPNGTSIIVRDVFYNTPARMKFLKSDISEGNAVAQVVDKCVLSHPEISFTFIRDTKIRLQTSGNGDLKAVIRNVYGKDMSSELLEVNYIYENKVTVTGFIGSPSNTKPTRTYQNFYINRRYVRTRTVAVALEEGFKGKIMTGRFPIAVLFVDLDYSQVDSNVHPAKIEVRFTNEKDIFNAVYYGVKNTINKNTEGFKLTKEATEKYNNPIPTFSFETNGETKTNPVQQVITYNQKESFKLTEDNYSKLQNDNRISFNAPTAEKHETAFPKEILEFNEKIYLTQESDKKLLSLNNQDDIVTNVVHIEDEDLLTNFKYIGEVLNTYIMMQSSKNELVLVDKHAVHERIIYEEIRSNSLLGLRQVLLSAIPVTLQKDEYSVLVENIKTLEDIGFLLEDFGTGTLLVREVPTALEKEDIAFLLSEIAEKIIINNRDISPDALNQLYYSIACKSALRGGDINNEAELLEIIKGLEKNKQITHCPHGRPVLVKITQKDIEKMFGRLG